MKIKTKIKQVAAAGRDRLAGFNSLPQIRHKFLGEERMS